MLEKAIICFLVYLCVFATGFLQADNKAVRFESQVALGKEIQTYLAPALSEGTGETCTVGLEIAEPTGTLTLRDALSLALVHNPELKAFSWEIRSREARQLQEGLWPNPELEIEIEEAGGPGARSGFDAAESTIQLSQLIELGNKSQKRTKAASFDKELAGWDFESKRLDIFTDVTKAFIDVLAGQENLKLNEELLRLSKELVDTIAKRVEAGKDSPLEEIKAKVAFSNIQIGYKQAVQDLTAARRQLVSFWAGNKPTFEGAAGRMDALVTVPSIDTLEQMLEFNPEVSRWDPQIDKEKAALELEEAKTIPDITISAGLQRFNETNDNAVVFGFSIPLPVSDRNQGGKLEAIYNLAKAREEERAAILKVRSELNKSYQKLSNAYIQATELEEGVLQGAEEVFRASKRAYTEGKLDYLHLLDSQRTWFEAKSAYIEALSSYNLAKTDVERLVGHKIEDIKATKNKEKK